jgi:hypothetical protein
MKILIKLLLWLAGVIVILILVAGYLGLVPGVSTIFGSDKPRDLGIVTSEKLFDSANEKIGITRVGNPLTAGKVIYSGSHPVNVSLSSEEISSLISEGKWKYNSISGNLQMKINSDGTVEVAGLLNRTNFKSYLASTGFSDTLAYVNTFNFLPEKVPFYVHGSASVVNNKVDLNLTSAEIGRVPLPTNSGAISTVENLVEERISEIPGLNVASFNFSNGKMNFIGTFPTKMSYQ